MSMMGALVGEEEAKVIEAGAGEVEEEAWAIEAAEAAIKDRAEVEEESRMSKKNRSLRLSVLQAFKLLAMEQMTSSSPHLPVTKFGISLRWY